MERGCVNLKESFIKSECPNCGNISVLNDREVNQPIHCRICNENYMYMTELYKKFKEMDAARTTKPSRSSKPSSG